MPEHSLECTSFQSDSPGSGIMAHFLAGTDNNATPDSSHAMFVRRRVVEKKGASLRIAIVQHGDYAAAYETYSTDRPEPYAGMKTSVAALEMLVADRQFLLVSLDAPSYRTAHRNGTLLGAPLRKMPAFMPRRIADAIRRAQIRRELNRFEPTHLLIRTSGQLATDLLSYGAKHSVSALVVFANVFDPDNRSKWPTANVIRLLNQAFVYRVGNHLQPAVDSMIECGLSPLKAAAYDFDVTRGIQQYEPKQLSVGEICRLVFAGNLITVKGCEDVILAAAELSTRGIPTELTVFGDGPDREKLQNLAESLPEGLVTLMGRQPNEDVVHAMRMATFVCVPSHRRFPEGMPLALTEALSTRAPVIASAHPVFVRAFRDGEGVRFVPEKQPLQIARVIEQVWNSPKEYAQLSRSTTLALDRIRCKIVFADLLREWEASFMPISDTAAI